MPLDELLPMVKIELRANKLWREEYDDEDSEWLRNTVDLIRQRFFTLKDFSSQGRAYFSDDFDFEEAAVNKNLRKEPRLRELLQGLVDKLETVEPFNAETSEAALRSFADESGVKAGLLINGSRTMLTGQAVGPSMFEIFDVIGREASVQRLKSGIRGLNKFRGVSDDQKLLVYSSQLFSVRSGCGSEFKLFDDHERPDHDDSNTNRPKAPQRRNRRQAQMACSRPSTACSTAFGMQT